MGPLGVVTQPERRGPSLAPGAWSRPTSDGVRIPRRPRLVVSHGRGSRGKRETPVLAVPLPERVVRVRLLLETLNDPYPTPRSALATEAGPAPSAYVPCEACQGRGEGRVVGGWHV